jgi:hypothetical protein
VQGFTGNACFNPSPTWTYAAFCAFTRNGSSEKPGNPGPDCEARLFKQQRRQVAIRRPSDLNLRSPERKSQRLPSLALVLPRLPIEKADVSTATFVPSPIAFLGHGSPQVGKQ